MIGLEYILKLWNMTQQELADKLGIKRQNIDAWIRKQRPIPKKHLPTLSKAFKELPEEYFQKELTEMDKLTIQQLKIRSELRVEDYHYTEFNDEIGEEVEVYGSHIDEEQELQDHLIEFKKKILKLHEAIDETIKSKFKDGVIDIDLNGNMSVFEAEELLNIYANLVGVVKRGYIPHELILKVIKGLVDSEEKHFGIYTRDIVSREVSEIVKKEKRKNKIFTNKTKNKK